MSLRVPFLGLSNLVREFREAKGLTQEQLAGALTPPSSRTTIAHLEQSFRVPAPAVIASICTYLAIPEPLWRAFSTDSGRLRLIFENAFSELIGGRVTLRSSDDSSHDTVEGHIDKLFEETVPTRQALDCLNTILVFYGIPFVSLQFFERYFGGDAFRSEEKLLVAVQRFQMDAIRLYPTLSEAFDAFVAAPDLAALLRPLSPKSLNHYWERAEWNSIDEIQTSNLSDLGYISARRIRSENAEREEAAASLRTLAELTRKEGRGALLTLNERKRRRLDTLLRKFDSLLRHDISSPLFSPDPDALEREAVSIAPTSSDLERMGRTQHQAYRNLCQYLSADHLDVYVATSMRSDADYVSVHEFARKLFAHDDLRPLKLRYFNPTQSWIGDRVSKGLVEALMLRRSDITIYMAQKEDTFGKDSEASVALGQGKPVIVYVPKLHHRENETALDSVALWSMQKSDLLGLLRVEDLTSYEKDDYEALDTEALASRALSVRLSRLPSEHLCDLIRTHWADFDLYGESERIPSESRELYRATLDEIVPKGRGHLSHDMSAMFTQVLATIAGEFERRARTFLLIHPLALQVITKSRIMNGILVVRSIDECGHVLRGLLENSLTFEIAVNDYNYMLLEKNTRSVVRVIPRHELIRSAFERFYTTEHEEKG